MQSAVARRISPPPEATAADEIVARLEEAGRTLLCLPNSGPSTGMRGGWPETVHEMLEAYGYTPVMLRPAMPSSADISRMDEALRWILLIPADRYVLRRIVGARALINPRTDRHVFRWRRIGAAIGADYRAVQRWHAQGIALIALALAAKKAA